MLKTAALRLWAATQTHECKASANAPDLFGKAIRLPAAALACRLLSGRLCAAAIACALPLPRRPGPRAASCSNDSR